MKTDLFDFDLPPDLIAQKPISPRDAARMLEVLPSGHRDAHVRDLPD
ncbi:MAG: S-adenosylmethionine:tRNA ribosyltransferase-isomerase, partial [Kangiella sp.]|nr:S-adenosylmethionine:tRNA ribosyltransferase-isomerase [Kangiella sp.]